MSELERDREREKETEIEEVTHVQLFTEKVNLRSSDSFVFVWRHSLYSVSKAVFHFLSFIPSFPPGLKILRALSEACPDFPLGSKK